MACEHQNNVTNDCWPMTLKKKKTAVLDAKTYSQSRVCAALVGNAAVQQIYVPITITGHAI